MYQFFIGVFLASGCSGLFLLVRNMTTNPLVTAIMTAAAFIAACLLVIASVISDKKESNSNAETPSIDKSN